MLDFSRICVVSPEEHEGFTVCKELPTDWEGGVVFADAGCKTEDIRAAAENLLKTGHATIGVQGVHGFFNKLTALVFRFFGGLKLQDVQPALLALPCLPKKLQKRGLKTKLLLHIKKSNLTLDQLPISPVKVKRPNPLQLIGTWFLILGHFIKYGASAVICAIFEEGLMALLGRLFLGVFSGFSFTAATAGLARLISSVCNFFINQKLVFESKGSTVKAMLRYYALALPNALLQIGISHGAYLLFNISEAQTLLRGLIHFGVMVLLFLFSFVLQQRWVFSGKKD